MFNDPHLAPRSANYQPLTPIDFLRRALEVHSDSPAVAWRDEAWSYAQFGKMVGRMAHWLRSQGVGKGDVVAVNLSNRPELLVAHYAVPVLGAVLCTINIRLDTQQVRYILEHSNAKLMLVEEATAIDTGSLDVPTFTVARDHNDKNGLTFFHGPDTEIELFKEIEDENQALTLNYTSGTTGKPKGVVYSHRGAYLNAIGNVFSLDFNRRTRYLWTLPMFHCNGWTHTWAVTAAGGMHVCLDKVDPVLIVEQIQRHQVTHLCCAPVVLYMLLNNMKEPSKVRVRVGTGGAAPTPTLLSGLEKLGFDLVHLYGLTESYGPATYNDPPRDEPIPIEQRAKVLARQGQCHMTAGRARVVTEDGSDVAPDGATMGEIVLRDNTLMAGYFRDRESTERAFDGGVFHTGDLAVMHPNGEIEIKDRSKDIIISGGENFSSLEVETALHQHAEILLAAVVAAPHEKWGEVGWAFIETKTGNPIDLADLDTFCRERLAGFKRPRRFIFGELPKTATGKIQKFELRSAAKKMSADD